MHHGSNLDRGIPAIRSTPVEYGIGTGRRPDFVEASPRRTAFVVEPANLPEPIAPRLFANLKSNSSITATPLR